MTGQQVKNSILQLAIQGRLVAQDPNDEPASVLLQRIREEKQRLVKEGKLKKKDLTTTPITEEEKPFDIPESWEWCRLGEICKYVTDGDHSAPPQSSNGVPFVVISCVSEDTINFAKAKSVPKDYYNSLDESRKPKVNDVLFTVTGSYGKVITIREQKDFCFQRHIALIRPFFDNSYLAHILRSAFIKGICDEQATGIAQKTVVLSVLRNLPIPLPPLAEQRRIVARIEELMPLVEAYGKAQEELEALNAGLPEALKKSILQEAIQGRLVPQDPNDEPASVLLARIRKEKEQLVKEGKLKKKDLTTIPITEEEKPFDIPESWEWCRLGEIISISSGDGLTSSKMIEGDIPVYGGNGVTGWHNQNNVSEPTIVIGRVGYYCGSVHITPAKAWVTDNAFVTIYPQKYIDKRFLVQMLRHMDLGKQHNATAQPVVSGKKIYPLLFPLPPLAEQRRIVAKIEELFALLK